MPSVSPRSMPHSGAVPTSIVPSQSYCEASPADVLLVLGRVERAGAVYQRASGTERVPCLAQNAPLPGRAQLGSRLAPLPSRLAVLAEHALARAGRVDQNQVEVVPERSETGRIGARYDDIPDPPPPTLSDRTVARARTGSFATIRLSGSGKARKKRRLASGSRAPGRVSAKALRSRLWHRKQPPETSSSPPARSKLRRAATGRA